jgi:hypothetical protein
MARAMVQPARAALESVMRCDDCVARENLILPWISLWSPGYHVLFTQAPQLGEIILGNGSLRAECLAMRQGPEIHGW